MSTLSPFPGKEDKESIASGDSVYHSIGFVDADAESKKMIISIMGNFSQMSNSAASLSKTDLLKYAVAFFFPSEENAVDLLTKKFPTSVGNALWVEGPSFLKQDLERAEHFSKEESENLIEFAQEINSPG